MTRIKSGLDEVVKEFGLEDYLSKSQRDDIEDIKLFLVTDPSFEKAKDLDKNGKWEQATNNYYTLYKEASEPIHRAQAYILLSQMYINLVKYNLARKFLLENKDRVVGNLSGWEKTFYEAQTFEKLGWINDYLGEIDEAIINFSHAKRLLSEEAKRDDKVLRVYETSNHFLGRQYAILAWQGQNTTSNVVQAVERFKESVQIYENLRIKGKADDAAEGFQYGWLTRMHILQGSYQEAKDDLIKMHKLFNKALKKRPGSGLMGYYYLLLARLRFEQGKYQESRESFTEALRINTEVVNYPSGQADAILGMGLCDYYLKEKEKAKVKIQQALALNPSLLYRGYI